MIILALLLSILSGLALVVGPPDRTYHLDVLALFALLLVFITCIAIFLHELFSLIGVIL